MWTPSIDGAWRIAQAQRLRLAVVVAEDEPGDVVRHLGEQLVPLLLGHVAGGDDGSQKDLDVHLVVGAADARRVVDRVRVDAAAGERVLDSAFLREAEVSALAHDTRAHVAAVDPKGVVRLVADVEVGLGGRLHVRADAAVPEQVDLGQEDRPDQLVRRERLGVGPERGSRLRRELDGLGSAGKDAAARRDGGGS